MSILNCHVRDGKSLKKQSCAVDRSTEIFAVRTLYRGGRRVGPLSRPACQIIFSRCTHTGANVEILVRRPGEIEIEVFLTRAFPVQREAGWTDGWTAFYQTYYLTPYVYDSKHFGRRQVDSRCWSSVFTVSPYIVLAPCRPSRHMEDLQGLAGCPNTAFLTQSQGISRRRYLFDAAAKS